MAQNKEFVDSCMKQLENACYYHIATSQLDIQTTEHAVEDSTYKNLGEYEDETRTTLVRFYPEHGDTEILKFDMDKIPKNIKTLSIARSKYQWLDTLVAAGYYKVREEIFKRANIKEPEDKLIADLVLVALDNYGWDLPERLKEFYKDEKFHEYYKEMNKEDKKLLETK